MNLPTVQFFKVKKEVAEKHRIILYILYIYLLYTQTTNIKYIFVNITCNAAHFQGVYTGRDC